MNTEQLGIGIYLTRMMEAMYVPSSEENPAQDGYVNDVFASLSVSVSLPLGPNNRCVEIKLHRLQAPKISSYLHLLLPPFETSFNPNRNTAGIRSKPKRPTNSLHVLRPTQCNHVDPRLPPVNFRNTQSECKLHSTHCSAALSAWLSCDSQHVLPRPPKRVDNAGGVRHQLCHGQIYLPSVKGKRNNQIRAFPGGILRHGVSQPQPALLSPVANVRHGNIFMRVLRQSTRKGLPFDNDNLEIGFTQSRTPGTTRGLLRFSAIH